MKILLFSVSIVIVLFILFQWYLIAISGKMLKQKYDVVHKDRDFELRFYPATIFAIFGCNATTYESLGSSGFHILAAYIFGGNATKTKLQRTTPIHMDINDTESTMSIVMPEEYDEKTLPIPNNEKIKITLVQEDLVAAHAFSGFASDYRIKEKSEKLRKLLKDHFIRHHGNFRFLEYNPPFQLMERRNEIIVSVDKF